MVGSTRAALPKGRWPGAAAAVVLTALLLSATFAAGFWAGEGRPSTGATGPGGGPSGAGLGPQGAGTGQGGAPQNRGGGAVPGQGQGGVQPGAGAQGQGLRSLDIIGGVQATNGGALTVQSTAGQRTVAITADTQIIRSDGSPGALLDLTSGLRVAVVATDGGQGLQALSVTLLPGR